MLEVVVKSDQFFGKGVIALIGSLIHQHASYLIDKITVLDFGMKAEDLRAVENAAKMAGVDLCVKNVSHVKYVPRPTERSWYTPAIYGFLYDEAFSGGRSDDVILALDADAILLSVELMKLDVKANTLYAATDYPQLDLSFQVYGKSLNTRDDDDFFAAYDLSKIAFNAGVMVAQRLTFQKVQRAARKFHGVINAIYSNDQGVLNLAVATDPEIDLSILDQRFNWRPVFNRAPDEDIVTTYRRPDGTIGISSSAFGEVVVCHFCGKVKPWQPKFCGKKSVWKEMYSVARYI